MIKKLKTMNYLVKKNGSKKPIKSRQSSKKYKTVKLEGKKKQFKTLKQENTVFQIIIIEQVGLEFNSSAGKTLPKLFVGRRKQ